MLLALILGCDEAAPPDDDSGVAVQLDADGDGFVDDDCDDTDPAVHPGADEACNGLDDDCDGEVDEEGPVLVFADHDGDGDGDYRDFAYRCGPGEGWVATDTDCDDTDPTVYGGAYDLPFDGVDQDCDGRDATCTDAGRQYNGDLLVTGADDLSAFCETYGTVDGDVIVRDRTTPDLSGLGCLCDIQGDLVVTGGTLTSLRGLDGLARVEGVDIADVATLERLDGLDQLQLFTDVRLVGLPALVSVEGLASAEGALTLFYLQDLPALPALTGLEGVRSATLVDLADLSALEDASALGGLTESASLSIRNAPALERLGLDALVECGVLSLENVGVVDLSGLASLSGVFTLTLTGMPALETTAGVGPLDELVNLSLHDNAALLHVTDLSGAAGLDDVRIYDNPRLADIDGLSALRTPGTVAVYRNALPDFAGLAGLTRVGSLYLGEPAVDSFAGLAALTEAGQLSVVAGGFDTLDFPRLTTVDSLGLSNLAGLADLDGLAGVDVGDVTLVDLSALASVEGLSGWRGGSRDDLGITRCDALTTLTGLGSLTSLGRLTLDDNAGLTTLAGLDALSTVDQLTITDNPLLPTAEADALCARAVADTADCRISGNQP
jgi:hypothetical protein